MLITILTLLPFIFAAAVTAWLVLTAKKAAQSHEIRCFCCEEARKCSFGFINMLSDAPIKIYMNGCNDTFELDSARFPELARQRMIFRRFTAVYAVMCVWSVIGMRENLINLVLLHKNGIFPALIMLAVLWFMFAALFAIPFFQYLKCTKLACKCFTESSLAASTVKMPNEFDVLNAYRRNRKRGTENGKKS